MKPIVIVAIKRELGYVEEDQKKALLFLAREQRRSIEVSETIERLEDEIKKNEQDIADLKEALIGTDPPSDASSETTIFEHSPHPVKLSS